MTPASSRARYKANVRETILNAARQIFLQEGFENFSMRALAQAVGYSPAATYRHFKNKAEISNCLAGESFAALLRSSENVKPLPAEDAVSRLKRGMLAYVNFGLQNPDHYRFAFIFEQKIKTTAPQSQAAYGGLRGRVQACIDSGKFRSGDSELMAQSLWAAAHGVTSLLLQKPKFPWADRKKLIHTVIDSAVAGLLKK